MVGSKISWEDNIIRDLKEIGYESDWKVLNQDRVIRRVYIMAAMNFGVP